MFLSELASLLNERWHVYACESIQDARELAVGRQPDAFVLDFSDSDGSEFEGVDMPPFVE